MRGRERVPGDRLPADVRRRWPSGWWRSTTPTRIPEIISRAFPTAMQGRPGPVVLALPEDMLLERRRGSGAARRAGRGCARPQPQMADLRKLLCGGRAAVRVLGGGGWWRRHARRVRRFAERFDLPVAASFRRARTVSGDAPQLCRRHRPRCQPQARGPHRGRRPRDPGRWPALARCRRRPIRCSTFRRPSQTLVHVHADAEELGRVYHARSSRSTRRRAPSPPRCEALQPPTSIAWRAQTARPRARIISAWTEPPTACPAQLQLGEVMAWLRNRASRGRHRDQRRRQLRDLGQPLLSRYRRFATQLAPTSGSMGYGAAGGGRAPSGVHPSARSSASPATAAS